MTGPGLQESFTVLVGSQKGNHKHSIEQVFNCMTTDMYLHKMLNKIDKIILVFIHNLEINITLSKNQ